MRRRRLAGAHLSDRDADLLEWVDELTREGLLAQAVKAGLRIARELCCQPAGLDYLRRGILSDAFVAGLLAAGPTTDAGAAEAIEHVLPAEAEQPSEGELDSPADRLAEMLDRALGGR